MIKSPNKPWEARHLSSKPSLDTMVSVKSNTKFFKVEKNPALSSHMMSLPLGGVKGVDLSNMPLNQIPFRLTQHPHVPFAISASDNALYEEFKARERENQK
jgi:hypothetical protein